MNPKLNDTSSSLVQSFEWQKLFVAEDYILSVKDSSGVIVFSDTTTGFTVNGNLNDEGDYSWEVKGRAGGNMRLGQFENFFVDTTRPERAVPIVPANDAILNGPSVDLNWARSSLSGSYEFDSVYLFTDSVQVGLFLKARSNDLMLAIDSLPVNQYYWWVKSYDNAGNMTLPDSFRSFTVQ